MSDRTSVCRLLRVILKSVDKLKFAGRRVCRFSHCKSNGKRIIVAFHVSSNRAPNQGCVNRLNPVGAFLCGRPLIPGGGLFREKGRPQRDAPTGGTEMTNE